ncbi:efflux RND transporter periplasmic adaptor subunit [Nitrosococcus watsonii]|uniref:Efflux transporter, RND family, MFP subunit n=2 Tax=Nitrosococcus TaxID=1227 RepID=D8K8Q8_NITWC|nr:efflux RND transporter periplasmic adaptor subunit [Nitrosococcus watsonii]ADJ27118.1 efflux transporter, RND family, MFP subunit [Nitrosococcus watsonii C-113]
MNFNAMHVFVLALVFSLVLFPSCLVAEGQEGPSPDSANTIEVSDILAQQIKVRPVGHGRVRDTLRLPGRVQLDEQRLARIGASVTGRITALYAILGQEVQRGDILAELNSTELGAAQAAYLKAASQVSLRKLAVSRAQRLLAGDVIGSAELQEREGELVAAQVEMQAGADQLRVLGMTDGDIKQLTRNRQIDSHSHITATLNGVVIGRRISLGQVVQPSDTLYTIADLSHVWLVAEIPENQAYLVREGQEAEVEIPALPGPSARGQLIYVADVVDPNTRTVTVRMDVPNPQRQIRPNMLASIVIHTRATPELVVPAQAIVRQGREDFVFVQNDPRHFTLRPVKLGPNGGEFRGVVSGLTVGEPIVVEGAFHLNNERLRRNLD